LRCNEQIRLSPIRLIDQDDQQAGIVETPRAMQMAHEAGMDLVEVAPTARPPVCRIMDYGKWKYAQKKKDQKAKVHRHEAVLKEVRMRPKTDSHDQMIKVNKAREFIEKGAKVQFTMLFRGREMVHLDIGRKSFNEIKEQLADVAKVERDFKVEGRRMTMVLASSAVALPSPSTKPKPAKPKVAKPKAEKPEGAPPEVEMPQVAPPEPAGEETPSAAPTE
jgi:translation initiation factor IF-3